MTAPDVSDPLQSLRDALAITTNALHERSSDRPWTETRSLAREVCESGRAEDVLMGQSHLTITLLNYISDLVELVTADGTRIEGVPGGSSPEALLQEFGRQVLEAETN